MLLGKLFFLFSFFVFLLCLSVSLCVFACLRALLFCAVERFFVCLRVQFCVRFDLNLIDEIVVLATTYSTFLAFVCLFPSLVFLSLFEPSCELRYVLFAL